MAEKLVNQGVTCIPEKREFFLAMTLMENLKTGAYSKNVKPYEKRNLKKAFDLFPLLAERQHQLASTMSGEEASMLVIAWGG